jgi:hypothetical protein
VRTAERFLHAQVREELPERLARHRRAAVGVHDELARLDAVSYRRGRYMSKNRT